MALVDNHGQGPQPKDGGFMEAVLQPYVGHLYMDRRSTMHDNCSDRSTQVSRIPNVQAQHSLAHAT